MASVKLNGDTSGYTILAAQPVALNNTLTLPNVTDTLVTVNSSTLNNSTLNTATLNTPTLNNAAAATGINFSTIGVATQNGVFLPAINSLAMSTNSNERLRVDSNGNVGIATTSISTGYKLQVQGNVYTSASMVAATGWAGTGSAAGLLAGIPMQLACERGGVGATNNLYSFGNGGFTQGVRMPFAGKIYTGTLEAFNYTGTLTVQVAINGTGNASYPISVTGSGSTVGATANWLSAPLSFNAGDNINYIITAIGSSGSGSVATLWYVFT